MYVTLVMQPIYYKDSYINLMHRVDTLLEGMIRNTALSSMPDGYERDVLHVVFLATRSMVKGGKITIHEPELHSVGATDVTNFKNPLGTYAVIRSYGIKHDDNMVAALVIGVNSFAAVSKDANYDKKSEKDILLRFVDARSLASPVDKQTVADDFSNFLTDCIIDRNYNHIHDTKYIWTGWGKGGE